MLRGQDAGGACDGHRGRIANGPMDDMDDLESLPKRPMP